MATEKDPQKEKAAVGPVDLDEKDRAILRLLQDNAKMTVREIAAKVHLSTTPVHERIRRLEGEIYQNDAGDERGAGVLYHLGGVRFYAEGGGGEHGRLL